MVLLEKVLTRRISELKGQLREAKETSGMYQTDMIIANKITALNEVLLEYQEEVAKLTKE